MYIHSVDALIPISLKRIAVQQMQAVERGVLSRDEAEQSLNRICKISREDMTAHLTREYDPDTVQALHYFGLI